MKPLSVLVVDDELLARKRAVRLLSAMPGVEVLGALERGQDALERVARGGVDVLLLDIQMPDLTGMEVADLLDADGPAIVYATAHAEHALRAFEQGAVDYVLKPVEAGRLRNALDRARRLVQGREARSDQNPLAERLPIETRKGVVLVPPHEVSHAVLDGELLAIETDRGNFSSTSRLVELEARLPGDRFVRVHRKALLNLDRVARLEPQESGGYLAHMDSGSVVTVSRAAARMLRRMLQL